MKSSSSLNCQCFANSQCVQRHDARCSLFNSCLSLDQSRLIGMLGCSQRAGKVTVSISVQTLVPLDSVGSSRAEAAVFLSLPLRLSRMHCSPGAGWSEGLLAPFTIYVFYWLHQGRRSCGAKTLSRLIDRTEREEVCTS